MVGERAALRLGAIATIGSIVLAPAGARAQSAAGETSSAPLHWDASAQAGVMRRLLSERPDGAKDAGFGPVVELTGHVALMPLVRLGGYVGYDISPVGGGAPTRDLGWGGLRAKIMSPWPRGDARLWLMLGFGYAAVHARGTSAGGGFLEVPFGIGASYKVRKPWELVAELSLRAAFGHTGSVYEPPPPSLSGPAGLDRFAAGLTIGVLIDL